MATIMTGNLIDQLQLCSITSAPQTIFSNPPASLKLFCPHLISLHEDKLSGRKRPYPETPSVNPDIKKQTINKGSIINTSGKKIFFPKGLKKKYCADFLDTNQTCKHGDSCTFVHAVYPQGFHEDDIKIIADHVNNTEGYSFAPRKKVS